MATTRRVGLFALLTTLAVAAPASAAFDRAQPLDLPTAGPLAAAIDPHGGATVAGLLSDSPARARIEVAARQAPGRPWRIAGFATAAPSIRDLQVIAGPRGTVLAWSEIGQRANRIVVATADSRARLSVRERVPVAHGAGAFPRLALLRNGAVAVAWRDGRTSSSARVRVATFDGRRFAGAPRTVGTDAAQISLAAGGEGAAVSWISAQRFLPRKTKQSPRRVAPRRLTVQPLDARGLPRGPAIIAARDAGATGRLTGAPDGRVVAAWLRPQTIGRFPGEDSGAEPPSSAIVQPVAFTRELLPSLRPARPVGTAGGIAGGLASVAFDGPGHTITALRATAVPGAGPDYVALSATATDGGPWSVPQIVAPLGFTLFDPVVVAPASGPLVVSTAAAPTGAPRWTVAATPVGGTPQAIGTTSASNGRGIAVARGGDRVLVAWPSLTGGVEVAEQG